jgi:hypothetical protein
MNNSIKFIDSPSDIEECYACALARTAIANHIAFLNPIVYRDVNRDFNISDITMPE